MGKAANNVKKAEKDLAYQVDEFIRKKRFVAHIERYKYKQNINILYNINDYNKLLSGSNWNYVNSDIAPHM